MRKAAKKVLASALALSLTLGAAGAAKAAESPSTANEPEKQTNVTVEDSEETGVAEVNTKADGTAVVKEVTNEATVKIASTVTVNGVEYKVTTLAAGTFSDADKVKKVTVPASITTIKKGAFTGATKLKTLTLKANAKKMTIKKGAFKGLNTKKMTVKVKKSQVKAYKKLLKKAGFKGKVKAI